ncbi:MAG: hypothetical protein PWP23_2822 [Candidatus Sumerlaeota bacterium]|nr:hypothetical protein [Candidatus Sumerlaeota bacterium]
MLDRVRNAHRNTLRACAVTACALLTASAVQAIEPSEERYLLPEGWSAPAVETVFPAPATLAEAPATPAQRDAWHAYVRAAVRFETARIMESEKELEAAMAATPDNPAIILRFADLLTATNQPQRSATLLDKLLEKDPENARARLLLARALDVQGYGEDAARQYEQVLLVQPENLEALTALATKAYERGAWEEVTDYTDKGLAIREDDLQLVLYGAAGATFRGDTAKGSLRWTQLIRARPMLAERFTMTLEALRDMGREDFARDLLTATYASLPSEERLPQEFEVTLDRIGGHEEVCEGYSSLIEANPDNRVLFDHYVAYLDRQRDWERLNQARGKWGNPESQ